MARKIAMLILLDFMKIVVSELARRSDNYSNVSGNENHCNVEAGIHKL